MSGRDQTKSTPQKRTHQDKGEGDQKKQKSEGGSDLNKPKYTDFDPSTAKILQEDQLLKRLAPSELPTPGKGGASEKEGTQAGISPETAPDIKNQEDLSASLESTTLSPKATAPPPPPPTTESTPADRGKTKTTNRMEALANVRKALERTNMTYEEKEVAEKYLAARVANMPNDTPYVLIKEIVSAYEMGHRSGLISSNQEVVHTVTSVFPDSVTRLSQISSSLLKTQQELSELPAQLLMSFRDFYDKTDELKSTVNLDIGNLLKVGQDIYDGVPKLSRVDLINTFLTRAGVDVDQLKSNGALYKVAIQQIEKPITVLSLSDIYTRNQDIRQMCEISAEKLRNVLPQEFFRRTV